MAPITRRWLAFWVGIALPGCATEPDGQDGRILVTVSPAEVTLGQLEQAVLDVRVSGADGRFLPESLATLTSSAPDLVTVDRTGTIRSVGPRGRATIVAATRDTQDSVVISVVLRLGPSSVLPAQATVMIGDTIEFEVAVRDAIGDPVARAVSFTSHNGLVAEMLSSTGTSARFAALRLGTAVISASTQGLSPIPFATLTVTPDTGIMGRLPLARCPGDAVVVGTDAFVVQRGLTSSVANAAGGVARIDVTTATVTDSLRFAVPTLAGGIAASPDGATLFVALTSREQVAELDRVTLSERRRFAFSRVPVFVEAAPAGDVLYVSADALAAGDSAALYAVDLTTGLVRDSLFLPRAVTRVRADASGDTLFVATIAGVVEVDVASWQKGRTFETLPFGPAALDLAVDGDRLWIAARPLMRVERQSTSATALGFLSEFELGWSPIVDPGADLVLVTGLSSGFTWAYGYLPCRNTNAAWRPRTNVHAVSRSTLGLVRTIRTMGNPTSIALVPAAGRMVVTNDDGWVDIVRWP